MQVNLGLPEAPEAPLRSALFAASKTGAVQFFLSHWARSASCPSTPSLWTRVMSDIQNIAGILAYLT